MIVVDPPGTLLRVGAFCLLAGLACSAVAAAALYLLLTRFPPRLRLGRLWAEWRKRPVAWVVCPLAGLAACLLLADWSFREIGLRDLYWLGRAAELRWIAWLGAAFGYLFGMLLMVGVACLRRRAASRRAD